MPFHASPIPITVSLVLDMKKIIFNFYIYKP